MADNTKFKKIHVKKGDTVRILSGRDRGKEGRVQRVVMVKNKYTGEYHKRAIVEGMNMVTKHNRPDQQNPQGAIVEVESGIHISNLMVVDKSGNATRIGRQKAENGKGWVRVSKKSGEILD